MRKRIVSIVLTLVMVLSLAPVFSINAAAASDTIKSSTDSRIEYMLKNIEYQNFKGSGMTAAKVQSYMRHFMFDASFAAIGGGTFNYPNSGAYTWEVTDGTYTEAIRGSTGCCAYCYFVSKVVYGKDWVDSSSQTKLYSAAQLKSFLLKYAQAGEHLRADPTHSVTFISGDDVGFYCFSYCGDNNPVISLDYWTYEAYYNRYAGYSIYVYDVFKSDNTSTWSCRDGHKYNCNVVTAPTESKAGTLRCYCPVCGTSKDVTLPKLIKSEDPNAPYEVTIIGSTTCTSGAVDRYTWKNTEYGDFHFDVQGTAGSHDYVYSVATDPTETSNGSLEGVCSKCGNTVYVTLPMLNLDDYAYTPPKEAPTCTTGCTGRYTWKNTQYGSYHFDKQFPPMGHGYFDETLNTITKEPTADSEGILICTCFRCNEQTQIFLPKISETEYSHEIKNAACTANGSDSWVWLVTEYGDVRIEKTLPATGHSYKNGACTRCGMANPEAVKANPFADLKVGVNYFDAILWAYNHEPQQITGGFTPTEFRPGNPCTRAQVVTFLWRAAGCPEPAGDTSIFKDAADIATPFQKAVAWAVAKGITAGFNDGTFRPNDPVSRAQFVTFLWRYEGQPATTGSINGFNDAVSIATPYQKAVAWAVEKGITTGYGDNTFRPNDVCTRWAVVLFMYRDMA